MVCGTFYAEGGVGMGDYIIDRDDNLYVYLLDSAVKKGSDYRGENSNDVLSLKKKFCIKGK